jgi:hypothetical protein
MSQATIATLARRLAKRTGLNPAQPIPDLLASLWDQGMFIELFLEVAERLETEMELKRIGY